jgi:Co/Zn/Cd efflux system component
MVWHAFWCNVSFINTVNLFILLSLKRNEESISNTNMQMFKCHATDQYLKFVGLILKLLLDILFDSS